MPKPNLSEVPSYYHNYINQVKEDDLMQAFQQNAATFDFIKNIPDNIWGYRYAADKWSIKEMVQHLIDAERIFCYRALCFARKDQTHLPSFDENAYAAASKADRRTKNDLLDELQFVQHSSNQLFASFDEEQLNSQGIANNKPVSVNAIGFIIIGHTIHHTNILQERYL